MLTRDILAQARAIEPEIVALRRAIHADPELGLHTPRTSDKVRAALAGLPLEWRQGPSTTGMVATLKGEAGPSKDNRGRRVLLRGDMDALPMPEETGLDFSSKVEGAMHACGHDAHTAMLVGAARLLCDRRSAFAGEVQFMFQPGEEGWHGAGFMLDDGLIDPLPDAAFALHIMPNAPHGVIAGRAGPLLAAADQLEIVIEGAGGHASMPHQTRDPVPVAAEIVMALQAMVTRQFNVHDPVVVTVASVSAGSAHNVIPDRAVLKGTMRSLSPASRARLRDAVELLAVGIAGAHGLTAKVTIFEGFPVTICDSAAVDFGEKVSRDMLGRDGFQRLADPIMGAEDFAYVLEKVPGAMFFLGVAPQGDNWASCCGIHSTRMMIDEGAMPIGSALLAALGERFLAEGFARMTETERLAAIEAIRNVKAAYFRGVDTEDGDLVRSILAATCRLDYRGCCADPKSGSDFMPAMNVVLEGRDSWVSGAFAKAGITSVHQGHQAEIEVTGPDSASATWAMTDRLYMPPGAPFALMQGFGFYHETYVREPDGWKIATLSIERIRVEAI